MCTTTRKRLAWFVPCSMIALAVIVVIIIVNFRGGVRRGGVEVSAISLADALQNFDEGFLPEYIRDTTLRPGMTADDVRQAQVPLHEQKSFAPLPDPQDVEGFSTRGGPIPGLFFDSVHLRMSRGKILSWRSPRVLYIGLRKTLEKAERLCVTREYVRTCLQALQAPHKRFVSETDMDIRGPDYRGKKLKWAYLLWLFDAYGVKVQFMPSRMFDQFLEDVGEGNIDNMGQHVAMRITPVEALSADRLSRRTIKFRLPTEEENVEYFGYVDEVIHELGLEQL